MEIEHGLVAPGEQRIGRVTRRKFVINVRDQRPFQQRPIQYPAPACAWLDKYTSKQCELGVMRRVVQGVDPDPTFTCSVVLVPKGQSGQEYRMCANVTEVNARTILPVYNIPDMQTVVDGLGDSTLFSMLDLTAGFNNIEVDEGSK